jgi:hypothetical protein
MDTTMQSEGNSTRGTKILNLICVLIALAFVALAVLNFLSEGSFFSTDSLFITLVWLMLAALFLSVPALDMWSRGVIPVPFRRRVQPAPVSDSGGTKTVTTDAKGRTMPPDVRRMVADMNTKQKQQQ